MRVGGHGEAVQRSGNQCLRRRRHGVQAFVQNGAPLVPGQAVVCAKLLTPAFKQTLRGVHRPAGLLTVKKCGAVLADLVGDKIGPV